METCLHYWKLYHCLHVIELPIRDGNVVGGFFIGVLWYVIELPIRDGNLILSVLMLTASRVIELPIRDGNSITEGDDGRVLLSYWTSYKGWKLGDQKLNRVITFSYWTSYKGWKQIERASTSSPMAGYWTSYKGWKLSPIGWRKNS